ncbi:hypothetical protein EXIGLDRAFT_724422 [Exidia glandulosa HHB12029]|uniref:Uncharacterized protein n=1 Tax=Exidia glandulosa HHB12029 TaxID=1314781 RepID=A0A165EF42_EXIGL|nr:hypothetical protein EXIGLDRAFT_724422 [Exidia glandulosa HHB12029]
MNYDASVPPVLLRAPRLLNHRLNAGSFNSRTTLLTSSSSPPCSPATTRKTPLLPTSVNIPTVRGCSNTFLTPPAPATIATLPNATPSGPTSLLLIAFKAWRASGREC